MSPEDRKALADALEPAVSAVYDAGYREALNHAIEIVEGELGYEDGEPSTERAGRWTFTAGAAALSELRTTLLALRDGAQ